MLFSCCFQDSLFIFNIWHLIMMCLGVVVFGSILCGNLCSSWTCMYFSFTKLGMFSLIIFSNKFSTSCSFCSSGTTMNQMLVHLKSSQRFLTLSLFFFGFFFFFLAILIEYFFFLVFQIIDFIVSFIHSAIDSLLIFLYFS